MEEEKNKKGRCLTGKEEISRRISRIRLVKKLVFVLLGPRDSIYELNRVGEHDETRARRISSARISPLSFYAVSRDLLRVFSPLYSFLPPPPSFFLMESSRRFQILGLKLCSLVASSLGLPRLLHSVARTRWPDLEIIGNGRVRKAKARRRSN